jgi:hypothetical protein
MRLSRLLLFALLVAGFVWFARTVPISGRTLWERVTGEAARIQDMAKEVEQRLGNQDVTERLRPEERQEVREIIKEKTENADKPQRP